MSPAAGRVFGPYRLLRSIAADAVTTTYAATTDGAETAHGDGPRFLLRIAGRADLTDDHTVDLVRQFLAESQRAGAVNHPSVIRPYDLGVVDGRPYVATPYVRAVPLGDMLVHGGAINDAAALAVFAQLAGALDAGHRSDVVHGALSPRTIWIGPSSAGGAPYVGYLTGFGTGVLLRPHLADETSDAPVDDVLYVAPEQLRGEPAGPASDQYSLACALYHTLVGAPPFERESRARLYGAHLLAPAPELAADETMAAATAGALRRGMSKQPSDRFDSCGLLINAALPERTATTGRRGVVHSSTPVGAEARRPWLMALAVVGLVVVGVVLWLLFGPAGGAQLNASGTAPPGAVTATPPAGGSAAASVVPRWSTAVAASPVTALDVVEGLVLATADDGTLAGVGPADGRVRWRANVDDLRELAIGGAAVVATADGLTAFDPGDGAQRWRVDGRLRSLQATDEAVVGADETASARGVRAIALADGEELWFARAPSSGNDDGGAPLTVRTDGDALVYALQDGVLLAIDQSTAAAGGGTEDRPAAPAWRVDVEDAWPTLAATRAGVAVAGRDGRVCFHARRTGTVMWCEAVPGSEVEQPSLVWTSRGLATTTSLAVLVLDPETGAPLWSVSPGSAGGLADASDELVVIAADDGAGLLDLATGDAVLSVAGTGAVTALAAYERWVVVGTGAGMVHRFDLTPSG